MNDLPAPVVSLLVGLAVHTREPAFVVTDDRGCVTDWGGALDVYGVQGLAAGKPLDAHFPAVHGLLPLTESPLDLQRVQVAPTIIADIYLERREERDWIILVNATAETRRQREIQQVRNELQLVERRLTCEPNNGPDPDPFLTMLAALDLAVMERLTPVRFRSLGIVPDWIRDTFPGIEDRAGYDLPNHSPFLENFMADADSIWSQERITRPFERSGAWTETDVHGNDVYLEAIATRAGAREVIILQALGPTFAERNHVLQQARENALDHRQLQQETEKKEILLHCIVHDLRSPVVSAQSCLDLLARGGEDRQDELLGVIRSQLERQDTLIRTILDVFADDMTHIGPRESRVLETIDVAECLEEVLAGFRPYVAIRGVVLGPLDTPAAPATVRVERQRLYRVVANLVENAIRHSKAGSSVTLRIEPASDTITVAVEDEGAGVPPELSERIFDRFTQVGGDRGNVGLGLHFCRIAIEGWGGSIGQENRETGGARFWFSLPRVGEESETGPASS